MTHEIERVPISRKSVDGLYESLMFRQGEGMHIDLLLALMPLSPELPIEVDRKAAETVVRMLKPFEETMSEVLRPHYEAFKEATAC